MAECMLTKAEEKTPELYLYQSKNLHDYKELLEVGFSDDIRCILTWCHFIKQIGAPEKYNQLFLVYDKTSGKLVASFKLITNNSLHEQGYICLSSLVVIPEFNTKTFKMAIINNLKMVGTNAGYKKLSVLTEHIDALWLTQILGNRTIGYYLDL